MALRIALLDRRRRSERWRALAAAVGLLLLVASLASDLVNDGSIASETRIDVDYWELLAACVGCVCAAGAAWLSWRIERISDALARIDSLARMGLADGSRTRVLGE